MLLAVLDTNILIANLRSLRASNDLKLVLADARRGNIGLVVPDLVLRELANKKREELEEAARRLRQSLATLTELGFPAAENTPDVSRLTEHFDERIRRILDGGKARVQPLVAVPHDDLLSRALARRKPFASSGAGYRDALIWHGVLDLVSAGNDTVVFVSNNSSDFAAPKQADVLAQDLKADLRHRGIDEARVSIVPDLNTFVKQHVAAETLAEGELERALNDNSPLRRQFEDVLSELLAGHIFDRDDIRRLEIDRLDLGFDVQKAELESADVSDVGALHGVWVISANLLDEDSVLIDLEAEMDCDLEASLHVELRRSLFDKDDYMPRREWRTRTIGRTALIGAEATFRRKAEILEDVTVHHVSV